MLFYKKENSDLSILGIDLFKNKVSTISGYPEKFFDSLLNGSYSMFDYSRLGIISITDKEIIIEDNGDDLFAGTKKKTKYLYLGYANNKEELLKLLNINNSSNSEREIVEEKKCGTCFSWGDTFIHHNKCKKNVCDGSYKEKTNINFYCNKWESKK